MALATIAFRVFLVLVAVATVGAVVGMLFRRNDNGYVDPVIIAQLRAHRVDRVDRVDHDRWRT